MSAAATWPECLTVVAVGRPAPQGSKTRTRYALRDANAERLKPWREAVRWSAVEAIGDDWTPMQGPLYVRATFTLPKPASAPKRRRSWPIAARSGDLDKLARAALDALTDAAVWLDDAQVTTLHARKTYPGEDRALDVPGVIIRIRREDTT